MLMLKGSGGLALLVEVRGTWLSSCLNIHRVIGALSPVRIPFRVFIHLSIVPTY